MNAIEFEQKLREQLDMLDQLDKDAQALRATGKAKQAAEHERRNASIRRQLERTLAGMPGRIADADARGGELLRELIDGIERRLAERSAAPPEGGAQ